MKSNLVLNLILSIDTSWSVFLWYQDLIKKLHGFDSNQIFNTWITIYQINQIPTSSRIMGLIDPLGQSSNGFDRQGGRVTHS